MFSNNELMKNRNDALNVLLNQTVENVVITDKKGRIELVSDGFKKMTGYTLEEVIGKKPGHILQGPETDPETVNKMAEAIKNKEPIKVDILNYTKQKEKYWIRLFIKPVFNKYGTLTGHVATEINLTDQYKLRDELTRTNIKLQKTIDEKDFFIGILSHDIKNSVGVIYSLSSIMSQSINSFTTEKIKDYVELINNTSKDTLNALKNIVEISKKNKEEYEIINLNDLVLTCLQKLYISYTMKKINIINQVNKNIIIKTVPTSLEIILNNIISNAIKFTNCEGHISINYFSDDLYHNISISDDGIGFNKSKSRDFKDLIYNSSSTGYGLYICKELVLKMKGEFVINKEQEIGSTVTIKLPKVYIKDDNSEFYQKI